MIDFYMAVTHEIGHALGINGANPQLKIQDYLSNALMADPVNPSVPGDPGDVLYSRNMNGGPIEATFTSAGTGGAGQDTVRFEDGANVGTETYTLSKTVSPRTTT